MMKEGEMTEEIMFCGYCEEKRRKEKKERSVTRRDACAVIPDGTRKLSLTLEPLEP